MEIFCSLLNEGKLLLGAKPFDGSEGKVILGVAVERLRIVFDRLFFSVFV